MTVILKLFLGGTPLPFDFAPFWVQALLCHRLSVLDTNQYEFWTRMSCNHLGCDVP